MYTSRKDLNKMSEEEVYVYSEQEEEDVNELEENDEKIFSLNENSSTWRNLPIENLKNVAKIYLDCNSVLAIQLANLWDAEQFRPVDYWSCLSELFRVIINQKVHRQDQLDAFDALVDVYACNCFARTTIDRSVLYDLVTFYLMRVETSVNCSTRSTKIVGRFVSGLQCFSSGASYDQLRADRDLISHLVTWASLLLTQRFNATFGDHLRVFWAFLKDCLGACTGESSKSSALLREIVWASLKLVAWNTKCTLVECDLNEAMDLFLGREMCASKLGNVFCKKIEELSKQDLVDIIVEQFIHFGELPLLAELPKLADQTAVHNTSKEIAIYILLRQNPIDDPERIIVLVQRLISLGLWNADLTLPLWLSTDLARCALSSDVALNVYRSWYGAVTRIKYWRGLVKVGVLNPLQEGPPGNLVFQYGNQGNSLIIQWDDDERVLHETDQHQFVFDVFFSHSLLRDIVLNTFLDLNVLAPDSQGESATFIAYVKHVSSLNHAIEIFGIEARNIIKRGLEFAMSHLGTILRLRSQPNWLAYIRCDKSFLAMASSRLMDDEPRDTNPQLLCDKFSIVVDFMRCGCGNQISYPWGHLEKEAFFKLILQNNQDFFLEIFQRALSQPRMRIPLDITEMLVRLTTYEIVANDSTPNKPDSLTLPRSTSAQPSSDQLPSAVQDSSTLAATSSRVSSNESLTPNVEDIRRPTLEAVSSRDMSSNMCESNLASRSPLFSSANIPAGFPSPAFLGMAGTQKSGPESGAATCERPRHDLDHGFGDNHVARHYDADRQDSPAISIVANQGLRAESRLSTIVNFLHQVLRQEGAQSTIGLTLLRSLAGLVYPCIKRGRPCLVRAKGTSVVMLPQIDVFVSDILGTPITIQHEAILRIVGDVPVLIFLLSTFDCERYELEYNLENTRSFEPLQRQGPFRARPKLLDKFQLMLSDLVPVDVPSDAFMAHAKSLSRNVLTILLRRNQEDYFPCNYVLNNCVRALHHIRTSASSDPEKVAELDRVVFSMVRFLSLGFRTDEYVPRSLISKYFDAHYCTRFCLAASTQITFSSLRRKYFQVVTDERMIAYLREKHRLIRCAIAMVQGTAFEHCACPLRILARRPMYENGGYFEHTFVTFLGL